MRMSTTYLLASLLLCPFLAGCGTPSFLVTPVSSSTKLLEEEVQPGKGAGKIAIVQVEGQTPTTGPVDHVVGVLPPLPAPAGQRAPDFIEADLSRLCSGRIRKGSGDRERQEASPIDLDDGLAGSSNPRL